MTLLGALESLDNMNDSFGSGFMTGVLINTGDIDLYDFIDVMTDCYIAMRNDICPCFVEIES